MALNYNENVVTKVRYNETEAFKVRYNDEDVLTGGNILCGFTQCDSGWSAVPPPYDDDGYHHGAKAPLVENSVDATEDKPIPISGNVHLEADVTNEGSANSYGDVVYQIKVWLMTDIGIEPFTYDVPFKNTNDPMIFKIDINTKLYSKLYKISLYTSAQSKSTHKNFRSRALLTVNSITLVKEE